MIKHLSFIFCFTIFLILLVLSNATGFPEENKSSNPEELGKIKWLRNLDEAKKQAEKEDKPIFLMFQEVPG